LLIISQLVSIVEEVGIGNVSGAVRQWEMMWTLTKAICCEAVDGGGIRSYKTCRPRLLVDIRLKRRVSASANRSSYDARSGEQNRLRLLQAKAFYQFVDSKRHCETLYCD